MCRISLSKILRRTPPAGIPSRDSVEEKKSYSAGFELVTATTLKYTFYRALQFPYTTIATLNFP